MSVQNLPVLELFTRLQKAGVHLGIDEYQLVLRAMQAGFGVSDRDALKRLCSILWIKSTDEERLLDYCFKQMISEGIYREDSFQQMPTSSKQAKVGPLLASSSSTSLETGATSDITVRMEDEVQVAQAVQAIKTEEEPSSIPYIVSDEYFPVTRRQMKKSWRYLRRPAREGPPVELDVHATLREINRTGILLEPTMVPARANRARLLLLIDHNGSMVPFHMLAHRLVDTALHSSRLGDVQIYYFHNCPTQYLYKDLAHLEYEPIEQMLNGRFSQWTSVLVFSDAGAARGGFNPQRIKLTEIFIKRFKQHFRYLAWLNPMPRSRWPGTTAGKVMQRIPMFDLSRQSLDEAMGVLRGRPVQAEYMSEHNEYE